MSGPGQRDLFSRVEQALDALRAGRYMIGVPEHLANDLDEVQIDSAKDFWNLLPELLEELKRAGPAACYCGGRPKPQTAGEELICGLKLWAYSWQSQLLQLEVYLKFCIKLSGSGEPTYVHVRLHKNRPPE